MARPKKKPGFDPDKIMTDLMEVVTESYEETGSLRQTAEEFNISPLKIRKILITAGAYRNEQSDEVNRLYAAGKTVAEIQQITSLGRASVNGYLPYTKVIYKPDELSANAERINVYRNRQRAVRLLESDVSEDRLREAVIAFQKYPFHTVSGLPYTYELKKGKDAEYTRELIVDRRSDSKTIVLSSVMLAFQNAIDLQGEIIARPKSLGDIRGISYIYPMLYRFGIIEVPERAAAKMELKRPLPKRAE